MNAHGGLTEDSLPERKGREGKKDSLTSGEADRFDEFWAVYPRKVDKQDAIKAWHKTTRSVDAEVLIAAAAVYARDMAAEGRKLSLIKHAATWLNKGSWDNPTEQQPTSTNWREYPRDPRSGLAVER